MAKLQHWLRGPGATTSVFGLSHDLFWAALAPLIAIMVREDFRLSPTEVNGVMIYVAVSFAVAAVIFSIFAMRQDIWEYTTLADLGRVTVAVAVSVLLVSFVVFAINRHDGISRAVPFMHFVLLLMPLVTARIAYRLYHDVKDRKVRVGINRLGDRREHVLVFGVNRLAEFYANAVRELSDGKVEIVGIVSNDERRHGRRLMSYPVLGHAKHLPHFMQEFAVRGIDVDKVVICARWEDIPLATQTILRKLERDGTHVEFLDEVLHLVKNGSKFGQPANDEAPVFPFSSNGAPGQMQIELPAYFRLKRLIDLSVAATLALCSLPITILVGLLNRLTIGSPVLFWQRRPGRHGINFYVYKFRTMLAPYDDQGNRVPDGLRQTALTRFIRRTRLDELPQLYNIIVGEMSLIGPRPLLPRDQPTASAARLAIAPGVTGWAQVNGGDLVTPDEKLALDLYYIRNASFWLDVKIILKTLQTVKNGDVRNESAIASALAECRALYPDLAIGTSVTEREVPVSAGVAKAQKRPDGKAADAAITEQTDSVVELPAVPLQIHAAEQRAAEQGEKRRASGG